MAFHLIKQIQLQTAGPVSLQAKRWRPIHLAQGDIDGACGPYSVLMVLLILGLMRWDEAASYGFWFNPKQAKGKFWRMLESHPGFFRDGTDLKGLQKLLQDSYGRALTTTEVVGSTDDFIDFVMKHLQNDQPVLVGVQYANNGGHWLVVIGYEEDLSGNIHKLLALDFSAGAPQLCAWNAYLDLAPAKGKHYKYTWVNANRTTAVRFDDALAVGKS